MCGADAGFPNVRMAELDAERQALGARVREAENSATARNCLAEFEQFGSLVATSSNAVIARDIGTLHSLVSIQNAMMITFHGQVRAGSRIPENNEWDRGRISAEGTIHADYYDEINYAALSLDGLGVEGFGGYSITLKEPLIAKRATAFEENCFTFCQRHGVIAGTAPPPGYRAIWSDRGLLAMAKLHSRLSPGMTADKFPAILLSQGTGRENADFIEVHIYGRLHPGAFERVVGPPPTRSQDRVLWRECKKALKTLGAEVVEV